MYVYIHTYIYIYILVRRETAHTALVQMIQKVESMAGWILGRLVEVCCVKRHLMSCRVYFGRAETLE